MKKLMFLISTEGKSPGQITEEFWKAYEVYKLAEEKTPWEVLQEKKRFINN